MRNSKYNDAMKLSILNEYKLNENTTVSQICTKYKISANTFYIWKRNIEREIKMDTVIHEVSTNLDNKIELENRTLRRLYINLSAHNQELAKFLEQ